MRKLKNLSKKEVLCVKVFDGTKKVLIRIAKNNDTTVSEIARKFIESGIKCTEANHGT